MLIPNLAFGANSVEIVITIMLLLAVVIPYYIVAIVLYYNFKKYNYNTFFTFLIYVTSIAGFILAYYEEFRFYVPRHLDESALFFSLKVLPLIILLLIAISKHHKKRRVAKGEF